MKLLYHHMISTFKWLTFGITTFVLLTNTTSTSKLLTHFILDRWPTYHMSMSFKSLAKTLAKILKRSDNCWIYLGMGRGWPTHSIPCKDFIPPWQSSIYYMQISAISFSILSDYTASFHKSIERIRHNGRGIGGK